MARHGLEQALRTVEALRCRSPNCPADASRPCWARGRYRTRRSEGLDVVGYLRSEIGLGESARLMVRALDAEGVPAGLIDVPLPGRMAEPAVDDRLKRTARHRASVSIAGLGEAPAFAQRLCRGQINILYPFWELPTIPQDWRGRFDAFDAAWAPTGFIADMLRASQDKPVTLIPQPVILPDRMPPAREGGGPLRVFTFFDYDSVLNRKNPRAAIAAFRAAFPLGSEDAVLKVKARGAGSGADRAALADLVRSDPRIEIVDRTVSRVEMAEMMAACDVFLSLHRSEGFGLGCAEAMALGKAVVATDFGGTCDFVTEATGYPVAFTPVALSADDYPGAEGAHWAEPDVGHAATILRAIHDDLSLADRKGQAGFAHLQANNSLAAVGAAIRSALARL